MTISSYPPYTTDGFSLITKTASYTPETYENVIMCDATAGAITISLKAASLVIGRVYTIVKTDASAYSVIIDPSGLELIYTAAYDSGTSTVTTTRQYDSISIISTGTAWVQI